MPIMIGGLPILISFFFAFWKVKKGVRLSGRKKSVEWVVMIGPASPAWSITPLRAVQIGIGIDLKKKRNNRA
jgi:hypothetical protein